MFIYNKIINVKCTYLLEWWRPAGYCAQVEYVRHLYCNRFLQLCCAMLRNLPQIVHLTTPTLCNHSQSHTTYSSLNDVQQRFLSTFLCVNTAMWSTSLLHHLIIAKYSTLTFWATLCNRSHVVNISRTQHTVSLKKAVLVNISNMLYSVTNDYITFNYTHTIYVDVINYFSPDL